MNPAHIGMIGLGVMGQNLARNLERHGWRIAVYNRELDWIERFIKTHGQGGNFIACQSLGELVQTLERPRKIWLMIQAGDPVDHVIEALLPLLDQGDILIDGGNSHHADTTRRTRHVESAGNLFIGAGVSGGEEGALNGPSLMPGGSPTAWPYVRNIFESIAAKTPAGEPCCGWVGAGGAGHFVKMVHNGIEYGEMQLIGEAYQVMKEGLELDNEAMAAIFSEWNSGELSSYLMEITAAILAFKDQEGQYVLDRILDSAGQKGTGKWAVIEAAHLGQPVTLIAEAVFARCLSAMKDERVRASAILTGPSALFSGERGLFIQNLRRALHAARLVGYAQGFALIAEASKEYAWDIDCAAVAHLWRAGCIIRSGLLEHIRAAFAADAALPSLMLNDHFAAVLNENQSAWRHAVSQSVRMGIPIPALSAALACYDAYRHARLPANLLQAQRDYFGAHTYERTDQPRGAFFHTNWVIE